MRRMIHLNFTYNNSLCKNSVRTSQETHYVSAIELFRERVAVYCENHTQHTDTLCGQNAEFLSHKAVTIVL
jgi:hypothetical protein